MSEVRFLKKVAKGCEPNQRQQLIQTIAKQIWPFSVNQGDGGGTFSQHDISQRRKGVAES